MQLWYSGKNELELF